MSKTRKKKKLILYFSMISPDKDIRYLVRSLERSGFEVTKKGNKHIKVVNTTDGRQVSIPSTPTSNGRQKQNMLMSLRHIGFDVSEFKNTPKKKIKK